MLSPSELITLIGIHIFCVSFDIRNSIMYVIPASHKTFLSLTGAILTVQLGVNKKIPGKLTVNPNIDFRFVPCTGSRDII